MPATFDGRYLLECAIEGGPSSMVWKGERLGDRAPVALKLFAASLVQQSHVYETGGHLIRSVQTCANPGVVAPIELVRNDEFAAVVTPWVEGPTLDQVVHAKGTSFLEVVDVRRWLGPLLSAIEAIHDKGLVHGALHPGVIFPKAGEVRVIGCEVNDWLRRLARGGGRARRGDPILPYLSPALREGAQASASDDIYALGAVIYEALTGTPPEFSLLRKAPVSLATQRRRNHARGGGIPENWERAVRRCLEPEARDRMDSVRSLRLRLGLDDVAPAAKEPAKPSPAPAAPPPAARRPPVAPAPAPAPVAAVAAPVPAPVPVSAPAAPAPVPFRASLAVAKKSVSEAELRPAASASAGSAVATIDEPPVTPPQPTAPVSKSVPVEHSSPAPAVQPERIPSWRKDTVPTHHEREHVSGVTALRAVAGLVAILAAGAGSWLVWQIVDPEAAARFEHTVTARAKEMASSALEAVNSDETVEGSEISTTVDTSAPKPTPLARTPSMAEVAAAQESDLAWAEEESARVEVGGDDAADAAEPIAIHPEPVPEAPAPPVTAASDEPMPESRATPAEQAAAKLSFPEDASREATVRLPQQWAVRPASGPPLSGGIFELGLVDVPPRVVDAEAPEISRAVLVAAAPAQVEVVVVVDRMGRVASASVSTASNRDLVEPCLQAARLWRFAPATRRGQAVAVRVAVPLVFDLPQS